MQLLIVFKIIISIILQKWYTYYFIFLHIYIYLFVFSKREGYDFGRKLFRPHYYSGLKLFEYSFKIHRFLHSKILNKFKMFFSNKKSKITVRKRKKN